MSDKDFEAAFSDEPEQDAEPAKAQEPAEDAPQDKAQDDPQEPVQEADKPDDGETKEPPQTPLEAEKAKSPVPGLTLDDWKAHLDEREKRQKFEREAETLRRENEQLKQQSQRKEEPAPDIYDNPEGYQQHIQSQFQQSLQQQKIETSEYMARREFGDEMFTTIDNWLRDEGRQFIADLVKSPSPYHAAYDLYRKEQAAKTLSAHDYDLDKLKAAWLAEQQASQPAAPASGQAQQQPAQKLPPKVAGAGGVTRSQPRMAEADYFESVFQS